MRPVDRRAQGLAAALVVLVATLTTGCGAPGGPGAPGTDAAAPDAAAPPVDAAAELVAALSFLEQRPAFLPQFAGGDDGSLYVVWRERAAERGNDLFLARRQADGSFAAPVRVNDIDGNASGGSLDEQRPAVSIGADGTIAIAWTSRAGNIRAALSHDGGLSFAPSLTLNADTGERVYRGFGDIAVDRRGVAHAAWIDGRFAPAGAEEPADLLYARVEDGQVTEVNLTANQADSICGCCRVDVDVRADDSLVIAFRNTGGGYRDIFRIEAGADRRFGQPARLGPPMWELLGCPVIGPLNAGDATLWSEASTGKRRILAATATDGEFVVVAEDEEEWAIERPPRIVVGSPAGATLLLLPGRPGGKILRGSGTDWTVLDSDVPRWAMSAVLLEGGVVVLGGTDGTVHVEAVRGSF